ncbi:ABC transporter permease [Alkalibacillus sp. S2W]|uniref:ABC transporter permease n=1 Tax=Alkalibacillus sp. S2W TaxID=3386553 RepID=UPI00398D107C
MYFSLAKYTYAWIVFIMIIQASTIITMEFQYGTIKNLLYRNYTRTQVIISKCITLFIYSISLYVSTAIIAIILKFLVLPDLSLSQNVNGEMSLIQSFLFTTLGNFIGVWLIISLVLLLSCVFRNTAVSVVIGIIFYFATSIVSGILFLAIEKWEWVKWNPFNMLNLSNQISSDGDIASMTQLSVAQLFVGNIIYIMIFLLLVFVVFRKKNV